MSFEVILTWNHSEAEGLYCNVVFFLVLKCHESSLAKNNILKGALWKVCVAQQYRYYSL